MRSTRPMTAADLADLPDTDYGVRFGFAATREDLPGTYQQTHDAVIEYLGNRRIGGVVWTTFDASEAPRIFADIDITLTRECAEWIHAYPNGFLVVAMAPAVVE